MKNHLIYGNIRNAGGGGGGGADAPAFPGDARPGNANAVPSELLYARSSNLIYATQLILWAQFVFSQESENLFPYVSVNSEKCSEHSSSHIIPVRIEVEKGSKVVRMTMKSSGKDCEWNGGAPCTYRVWGGSKTYSSENGHGCSKNGTCGSGASFTVVLTEKDYRIV